MPQFKWNCFRAEFDCRLLHEINHSLIVQISLLAFSKLSLLRENYSADLNYPDKTNIFENSNAFFSNWVNISNKRTEPKLLRVSPEIIWCNCFSKILNLIFTPKMGNCDFSQLIKNYAETTLFFD